PEGLFSTVLVAAPGVPGLIRDPRVRAVTLTGSDRAGTQVAEQAARELQKTLLELGGSGPLIVLADAGLPPAARTATAPPLVDSGRGCIAAKRFIVVDAVAERFIELFVAERASRRVGDPLGADTQVGPLARHDLRAALHRQVEESVRRGATLRLGGRIPLGP